MDASQTSIRDQILIEAARLFVQRGYDGISMREIAEACLLSKAGIYYHFKDKEDLFIALLTANLDHLHVLWQRSSSAEGACRARITRFARSLFELMSSDERAVIRLANQEMGKLSPARRETFNIHYQSAFLLPLTAELEAGVASGEFKPRPPHLLTWILLGMLYPFLSPTSDTRPEARLEAVDTALAVFFEGAAL
jgi:AcrR family transcriptional regulator